MKERNRDFIIPLIEDYYLTKEDTEVDASYDENGNICIVFADDVMQRSVPLSSEEIYHIGKIMYEPAKVNYSYSMHRVSPK